MIFKEVSPISQVFKVGDKIKVKDNYPGADLHGKEGEVTKAEGIYFPVTARVEGVGNIKEYLFYDDELDRVFKQ